VGVPGRAECLHYVTDRGEGLRPRGTTLWPEPTSVPPTQTVKIVRLEHNGNSNPEPLAYERFKLLMGNLEKVKVEVEGPTPSPNCPKAPPRWP